MRHVILIGAAVASICISGCPASGGHIGDAGHLTLIGLAIVGYGEREGKFPDNIYDKNGKALLSWRVAILPYLGDDAKNLYKMFHLNEPWDSPHNLEVARKVPEVYYDPNYYEPLGFRFTPYLAVTGENAAFRPHKPRRWSKGKQGVLVVVAKSDVFWTEPRDISIEDAQKEKNLQSRRYLDAECTLYIWGADIPKPPFEFVEAKREWKKPDEAKSKNIPVP
jgi:hypothetical protein